MLCPKTFLRDVVYGTTEEINGCYSFDRSLVVMCWSTELD